MLTPYTAGTILDTSGIEAEDPPTDVMDGIALVHMRTVDALRGYVKMVEKAEAEFRPVAQQFHDLHDRHAAQLGSILTAAGRTVDEDGSFLGTVNETVVGLRAFFDEIDADVMDNLRSGEEAVLRAFDGALEAGLQPEHQAALVQMRDELAALLDATRQID